MATSTTTSPKMLDDLHFEHQLWLKQIGYAEDELELFIRRLETLSSRATSTDAGMIEQFQNRFIRQREVMDELKHDVRQHERNLTISENSDRQPAEDALMSEHNSLADRVYTFEKLYAELKMEFREFSNR